MSLLTKAQDMIGKPYDAETFNCWHLVMGLVPSVPTVDIVATKMVGVKYFTDKSYYSDFHEVYYPRDGDVVLMGKSMDLLHHAGVVVDGGVLHAEQPSAVFRSIETMRKQYKEVRFYRANN